MDVREVHTFWEVLPQQTVGVLVRTPLPRASRITKVDFDVSVQAEAFVIRHFLATIPGQRFVEFPR